MTCGHCCSAFEGTISQYRHHRYEGNKAYCSRLCRFAAAPKPPLNGKPRPILKGICEHCKSPFESKTAKFFCTLRCYVSSTRFKSHYRTIAAEGSRKNAILARAKGRELRACIHCQSQFEVIKSSPKKFCARLCMRRWLAGRFDRWIASPRSIALPQNYDEFLSSDALPCLVEECVWVGAHLSIHMNQAHGVPAAEFKRAAGFNIHSGIISAPLQEALSSRDKVGVALSPPVTSLGGKPNTYRSLEGREHRAKAMAVLLATAIRPQRVCAGCGATFQQSTPCGRTKYCSIACRSKHARY